MTKVGKKGGEKRGGRKRKEKGCCELARTPFGVPGGNSIIGFSCISYQPASGREEGKRE